MQARCVGSLPRSNRAAVPRIIPIRARILVVLETQSSHFHSRYLAGEFTLHVAVTIHLFHLVTRGGNSKRVTSFVDHPLEIDLQKPFTFLAWCYSSDTMDWQTIFSFESPLCHSSLLCVTLMPGGSQIFFAYMRDAQRRIDVIANGTNVPTLAWFHFAFVFVGSTTVALYINGAKEPSVRLDASLFNPGRVEYPLHLHLSSLSISAATEAHYSRAE